MTAPIVNHITRTPVEPPTGWMVARLLGDGDLSRGTSSRVPGQLWSRVAERAETHQ